MKFGYDPEDLVEKDAISLTATPESVENIQRQISLGTFGPYEVTGVKKDGTEFPMEIRIKSTSYKGRKVRLTAILDLTERKQAEKMLKKAHDELEKRVQQRTAELLSVNDQLKIEIEDRKRAEKQIKASVNEKKVLLREIHHRVKNNFEIISSLLDMNSMHTENLETQNLLADARSRIYSMALIHGQLYQSDRFDKIDMKRHVHELMDHLYQVYTNRIKRIQSWR